MMNYVKSEFYRVSRGAAVYMVTLVLAALALLLNVILYAFGRMDSSFRYATTSFSYSNLVGSPMIFCMMAAIIAMVLYEGNRKNGNLKNTIAFGISRIQIFAGECIVAAITSIVVMIVVLTAYIAGAVLLLEQTGPVMLEDLLTEIPAVFLIAIASLISAIVCLEAFEKEWTGFVIWLAIWLLIPKVFFYMGLRIDVMYDIAMWMPDNFFGVSGMAVNMSQCITAWETAVGMAKCMISGAIGIALFTFWGVILLRKREL